MHTIDLNISLKGKSYKADLSAGMSLGLPVNRSGSGVNAYHIPDASFEAFRMGAFVGSVSEGGPCNCEVIQFCAHGNGTHTESAAHLSEILLPAHIAIERSLMGCQLLSIQPKIKEGDRVITLDLIPKSVLHQAPEAMVVRTLPNLDVKKHMRYSGTNPCYFSPEVMEAFKEAGIKHLLFDQPSVDREEDGGRLEAHKSFFYKGTEVLKNRTITELIYVPHFLADGLYLLQLAVSCFDSDAAPSNPILYPLNEQK